MAVTKDEIAHVNFLRTAILAANSTPVAQPAIDIGASFSIAANAAFNATLPVNFSPYGSDVTFYLGAFIFEDVGSSACECAGLELRTQGFGSLSLSLPSGWTSHSTSCCDVHLDL